VWEGKRNNPFKEENTRNTMTDSPKRPKNKKSILVNFRGARDQKSKGTGIGKPKKHTSGGGEFLSTPHPTTRCLQGGKWKEGKLVWGIRKSKKGGGTSNDNTEGWPQETQSHKWLYVFFVKTTKGGRGRRLRTCLQVRGQTNGRGEGGKTGEK